ncbi:hypothetical protein [Falsihalocynthiibacter arcticus]
MSTSTLQTRHGKSLKATIFTAQIALALLLLCNLGGLLARLANQ